MEVKTQFQVERTVFAGAQKQENLAYLTPIYPTSREWTKKLSHTPFMENYTQETKDFLKTL